MRTHEHAQRDGEGRDRPRHEEHHVTECNEVVGEHYDTSQGMAMQHEMVYVEREDIDDDDNQGRRRRRSRQAEHEAEAMVEGGRAV